MNWLLIHFDDLEKIENNKIPADVRSHGICNDCFTNNATKDEQLNYIAYGLCLKPCVNCGKKAD